MSVESSWVRSFTLASLFKDCEATTNLLCLVADTNNFTKLSYNPKTFVNIKKSTDIYNNVYRRVRSFAKSSTKLSSVKRNVCVVLFLQR